MVLPRVMKRSYRSVALTFNTKDLESVVYLIKNVFFVKETEGKTIHYYQDPKGLIWLNFDYNDKYPGNKYQSDVRESEIEI